jgi:hypothetical protein
VVDHDPAVRITFANLLELSERLKPMIISDPAALW